MPEYSLYFRENRTEAWRQSHPEIAVLEQIDSNLHQFQMNPELISESDNIILIQKGEMYVDRIEAKIAEGFQSWDRALFLIAVEPLAVDQQTIEIVRWQYGGTWERWLYKVDGDQILPLVYGRYKSRVIMIYLAYAFAWTVLPIVGIFMLRRHWALTTPHSSNP